jgi:hypothetical protein
MPPIPPLVAQVAGDIALKEVAAGAGAFRLTFGHLEPRHFSRGSDCRQGNFRFPPDRSLKAFGFGKQAESDLLLLEPSRSENGAGRLSQTQK